METIQVTRELIDSDNVTEISDYYPDYYEDEWEELEYEEEEEKDVWEKRKKSKEPEEIDIFAELLTQFRDKRAEKLAAQVDAEKGRLRDLIGIKTRRGDSEETLITPEEVSVATTESSTESSIHPCLKDIDISDSQLKLQNLYTTYFVPDDPGLVPAFWTIQDRRPDYTDDGAKKYLDLSKEFNIKPIQSLEEMLLSDRINLQYYGINSRAFRPLCEALIKNPLVQKVNLKGNWLSEDACYHLNDLLLKNNMIHTLILSGCKIGPNGAAKLREGIVENTTLKKLDLSDCNIGSEGFEHISEAIRNNESIQIVSLNNNHLDEACAEDLQKLLASSKSVRRLSLSWNSLYTVPLWKNLIKGLEFNEVLLDLDLSWNALGKECIPYLRQLLLRSTALEILRIDGNRFNDNDVPGLVRGLSNNETLQELYIGNNPIRAAGVLTLLNGLTPDNAPDIALSILDLTNIWAKKDILPVLESIHEGHPMLDIRLGGILSNYKLKGPDVKAILLRRANFEAMKPKKKRQKKNFGHFVLTLEDNPVSKGKFSELIRKFKLKLSPTLIREMVIAFASTHNIVDLGLLKSVYLNLYPDTKPPAPKGGKKRKKKGKSMKIDEESIND